ncbi:MAG TPA: hypothetical protein VIS05_03610, partial [Ilumatobacter sp.]
DEEFDEGDLDVDDEGDLDVDVDDDDDAVADADDDDDEDDDDDRSARARKRKAGDDEDDDDDEMLAPDDVEADLDTILKDRMVTVTEDDDEDDDDDEIAVERADGAEGLQPKRANEILCNSCFLLVRPNAPGCPVEDDACPIFT